MRLLLHTKYLKNVALHWVRTHPIQESQQPVAGWRSLCDPFLCGAYIHDLQHPFRKHRLQMQESSATNNARKLVLFPSKSNGFGHRGFCSCVNVFGQAGMCPFRSNVNVWFLRKSLWVSLVFGILNQVSWNQKTPPILRNAKPDHVKVKMCCPSTSPLT